MFTILLEAVFSVVTLIHSKTLSTTYAMVEIITLFLKILNHMQMFKRKLMLLIETRQNGMLWQLRTLLAQESFLLIVQS